MKKLLAIVIIAAALGACTDSQQAARVLASNGYTRVEITGYRPFMCQNDLYRTGFKAIAPGGQSVQGAVCASTFKGATIRFD